MARETTSRAVVRALAIFLRNLSDDDILALEHNDARIVVERTAPRSRKRPPRPTDGDVRATREQLQLAASREEALAVLLDRAPLRAELRALAADMDLPVPKSDTVERLRNRIVEATIGFRLRSQAIRSVDSDPSE